MVIAIKRDSELFEPAVTDELNKAFYGINKNIEAYESKPLAYKEEVRFLADSNSFRSGNLICIRETIPITSRHDTKFDLIKTLNISVPYDVWCYGVTGTNEPMMIHILDNGIYAYGMLSSYPQTLYICTDIIVPKN